MGDNISVSSTLLSQVPVDSAVTSSLDQILIVSQDGSVLVRRPWGSVASGFMTYVGDVPASPTSYGVSGDIAVSPDAVFTHDGNLWGKTPRATGNWDDVSGDSRFLLVSDPQVLSDAEKSTGKENLGITLATSQSVGLVKPGATLSVDAEGSLSAVAANGTSLGVVSEGDGVNVANGVLSLSKASSNQMGGVLVEGAASDTLQTVMSAADVRTLFSTSVSYTLPVAAATTLGGIKASDSISVSAATGVATVTRASVIDFGIVKLAQDATTPGLVPTVGVVSDMIQVAQWEGATIPPATYSKLGGIIPTGPLELVTGTGGVTDGRLTVKSAQVNTAGIVFVTPSSLSSLITNTYDNSVTTLAAVKTYVTSVVPKKDDAIASPSTLGKIKSSTTVAVNQTTGVAIVPQATQISSGVVTVMPYPGPEGDEGSSNVPSFKLMETRIAGEVASVLRNLPYATPSDMGVVYMTDTTGTAASKYYVDSQLSGIVSDDYFRSWDFGASPQATLPTVTLPGAGWYEVDVWLSDATGASLPAWIINLPFQSVILRNGTYYTGAAGTAGIMSRMANMMSLRSDSVASRCFLSAATNNNSTSFVSASVSLLVRTTSSLSGLFTTSLRATGMMYVKRTHVGG